MYIHKYTYSYSTIEKQECLSLLVWTKPILKQLGYFSHPTGCLQNLDIFPYSKSHFQQTSTSLKKKPWVSALMGIIASYYSVFFQIALPISIK